MKDLLISALDEGFDRLQKQIPQTKKSTKSVSILNVSPLDLALFMANNNIPSDAYFDGRDNGYDAWDDILLSWEIDIPTNSSDKLAYSRRRFDAICFPIISTILTSNEYKRIGFDTSRLKDFKDTTIYDMYMDKDFDRLVSYYSLYFVKA